MVRRRGETAAIGIPPTAGAISRAWLDSGAYRPLSPWVETTGTIATYRRIEIRANVEFEGGEDRSRLRLRAPVRLS